jgi:hypothetical protein
MYFSYVDSNPYEGCHFSESLLHSTYHNIPIANWIVIRRNELSTSGNNVQTVDNVLSYIFGNGHAKQSNLFRKACSNRWKSLRCKTKFHCTYHNLNHFRSNADFRQLYLNRCSTQWKSVRRKFLFHCTDRNSNRLRRVAELQQLIWTSCSNGWQSFWCKSKFQ